MKLVIVQRKSDAPDITDAEMHTLWERAKEIPGVDELEIKLTPGMPTPLEVDHLVGDADAVIGLWVNSKFLTAELFESHPRLKYIAGLAHGYEDMDFAMTRRYNVVITNTSYGDNTIAEYAFALLLAICHGVETTSAKLKAVDWDGQGPKMPFLHTDRPQWELLGKTLGIIGLGKIGAWMARMGHGFGMNVLAYSRSQKTGEEAKLVQQVSLDTLLAQSDVISLHCALNAQTRYIICADTIAKMKDGVILLNTSRGGLVDEDALTQALQSGKILAAGLDVMSQEPPERRLSIMNCDNAILTPHIAWLPRSSRLRQVDVALENFKNYLEGHPTSVVNKEHP
jgi:glycerate dehydrogenase